MDLRLHNLRSCEWWARLPFEIKLNIFQMVITDCSDSRYREMRKYDLSACAVVCHEWQAVFEKANFRTITLGALDIEGFTRVVIPRIQLVTRIWLRIELSPYSCRHCRQPESIKEARANNDIFSTALYGLFQQLSAWEDRNRHTYAPQFKRITLELSAHSPSDATHFGKMLQGRISDSVDSCNGAPLTAADDKRHWWANGSFFPDLPSGAKERLFGAASGLELKLCHLRLPLLRSVKAFIIRRQFYRHFSVKHTVEPILKSLPRLETFHYEPWRGLRFDDRLTRNIAHCRLLKVLGRCTKLKKFSMFENYSSTYHNTSEYKVMSETLGLVINAHSKGLEELYVSLNADATEIFDCYSPYPFPILRHTAMDELYISSPFALPNHKWQRLKSIALTCRMLTRSQYDEAVQKAALTADTMPQLEIMELWNVKNFRACIFRYTRNKQSGLCKIYLANSWQGDFSLNAKQRWQITAEQVHGSRVPLETEIGKLTRWHGESYANIVPLLYLRDSIMHPTSQSQLLQGLE